MFQFRCSAIRVAKHTLVGLIAILSLLVITPASAQWELNTEQTQQVETYLNRINADGLLIEHLESATSTQTHPEARRQLGRRLLQLYAKRMMSGRESEDSKWREKSELLLITYPQLDSDSIRIAMLQSKYREGEILFGQWWKGGRDSSQISSQQDQWRELTAELTNLNQALESSYQDQIAAKQSQGGDTDSKEILRTERLLLHTNYLLGWSAYFTGVLNPNELKTHLRQSDARFRDFLQLEPNKPLTGVPEAWFDFSSAWQVRALVGLAMVQRGLNYPSESKYCFDLIENQTTDQKTRDRRYVWEFNSRIYLNDYAGSIESVEAVSKANQLSKNGRVSYWHTVIGSGFGIRSSAPLVSKKLVQAGLVGLTREFQAAQISLFAEQNQFQPTDVFTDNENSFEALWVAGLLDFHHAQINNQPDFLATAKSKLQNAVAAAGETTSPLDVYKCKFLIAKIDHLHRNFSAAAEAFLEASLAFEAADRELAAESQWLATRSLVELSRRNSRSLLTTNRAIDAIIRRFPGSTYAKRAEFEKLRVNLANVPPAEAVNRLSEVSEQSLNYPAALNEIVKRRYEDWLEHFQANSKNESEKLISLLKSELNYRSLPNETFESKTKSSLLVIDALLRLEDFERRQVRQRLDVAGDLVNQSGPAAQTGNLYFEYRYYEFLFANRAGEAEQAELQAIWLSENAKGTRFEKSALVQLAQSADQRYRDNLKTNPPTPNSTKKLIPIFERLVSVLGSSPQALTTAPNARIAYARLAELYLVGGEAEQAIEMFSVLNQLSPNNKNYLMHLGRALSRAGQFEKSSGTWRRLASGTQPGSELWFESKYNLAFALFKTGNHDDSQELISQTIRLSPQLSEKWKQQFDELSSLIKSQ